MSAEQSSSDAAKARSAKRIGYALAARHVLGLARLALKHVASEINDVPTDLPHSDSVKAAYEETFRLIARDDWEAARESAFELGVMALGWCARMDLATMRESGEYDPRRICEECSDPIPYTGRGRPGKRCAECKA